MGSEWQATTLGTVIELKRGYDLPTSARIEGAYPVVSSSGISGYHAEAKVAGPGVVTGRYGTIGQVFYITEPFWPLNTTLYVRDFKGNDPRYVSYLLRTVDYQAYSDKAAVPGVNRNDLHTAGILLPPLPEQRAIAGILGALDDKIELNRRTNETLEAIARAIFKSWFVDFDPVKRNAEGRGPRDECDALFPDGFGNSELGRIPRGWRVTTISAVASISKTTVKPNDCPKRVWEHYSIPAYDAGGVALSEVGESIKSTKYRVPLDSVLVSKLNPQFPRVWLPDVCDGESAICSTEFIPFIPSYPTPRSYLYELMRSDLVQQAISERVTGSTGSRQRVRPDNVAQITVVEPPQDVLRSFDPIVNPIHVRIRESIRQSQSLAELRDTLLPKLISGDLRVPDAERWEERGQSCG